MHPEYLAQCFAVGVYQVSQSARARGWHTPLVLALRRQKQVELCEFERPACSTELVLGWPRLPEKPFLRGKSIQAEGSQE